MHKVLRVDLRGSDDGWQLCARPAGSDIISSKPFRTEQLALHCPIAEGAQDLFEDIALRRYAHDLYASGNVLLSPQRIFERQLVAARGLARHLVKVIGGAFVESLRLAARGGVDNPLRVIELGVTFEALRSDAGRAIWGFPWEVLGALLPVGVLVTRAISSSSEADPRAEVHLQGCEATVSLPDFATVEARRDFFDFRSVANAWALRPRQPQPGAAPLRVALLATHATDAGLERAPGYAAPRQTLRSQICHDLETPGLLLLAACRSLEALAAELSSSETLGSCWVMAFNGPLRDHVACEAARMVSEALTTDSPGRLYELFGQLVRGKRTATGADPTDRRLQRPWPWFQPCLVRLGDAPALRWAEAGHVAPSLGPSATPETTADALAAAIRREAEGAFTGSLASLPGSVKGLLIRDLTGLGEASPAAVKGAVTTWQETLEAKTFDQAPPSGELTAAFARWLCQQEEDDQFRKDPDLKALAAEGQGALRVQDLRPLLAELRAGFSTLAQAPSSQRSWAQELFRWLATATPNSQAIRQRAMRVAAPALTPAQCLALSDADDATRVLLGLRFVTACRWNVHDFQALDRETRGAVIRLLEALSMAALVEVSLSNPGLRQAVMEGHLGPSLLLDAYDDDNCAFYEGLQHEDDSAMLRRFLDWERRLNWAPRLHRGLEACQEEAGLALELLTRWTEVLYRKRRAELLHGEEDDPDIGRNLEEARSWIEACRAPTRFERLARPLGAGDLELGRALIDARLRVELYYLDEKRATLGLGVDDEALEDAAQAAWHSIEVVRELFAEREARQPLGPSLERLRRNAFRFRANSLNFLRDWALHVRVRASRDPQRQRALLTELVTFAQESLSLAERLGDGYSFARLEIDVNLAFDEMPRRRVAHEWLEDALSLNLPSEASAFGRESSLSEWLVLDDELHTAVRHRLRGAPDEMLHALLIWVQDPNVTKELRSTENFPKLHPVEVFKLTRLLSQLESGADPSARADLGREASAVLLTGCLRWLLEDAEPHAAQLELDDLGEIRGEVASLTSLARNTLATTSPSWRDDPLLLWLLRDRLDALKAGPEPGPLATLRLFRAVCQRPALCEALRDDLRVLERAFEASSGGEDVSSLAWEPLARLEAALLEQQTLRRVGDEPLHSYLARAAVLSCQAETHVPFAAEGGSPIADYWRSSLRAWRFVPEHHEGPYDDEIQVVAGPATSNPDDEAARLGDLWRADPEDPEVRRRYVLALKRLDLNSEQEARLNLALDRLGAPLEDFSLALNGLLEGIRPGPAALAFEAFIGRLVVSFGREPQTKLSTRNAVLVLLVMHNTGNLAEAGFEALGATLSPQYEACLTLLMDVLSSWEPGGHGPLTLNHLSSPARRLAELSRAGALCEPQAFGRWPLVGADCGVPAPLMESLRGRGLEDERGLESARRWRQLQQALSPLFFGDKAPRGWGSYIAFEVILRRVLSKHLFQAHAEPVRMGINEVLFSIGCNEGAFEELSAVTCSGNGSNLAAALASSGALEHSSEGLLAGVLGLNARARDEPHLRRPSLLVYTFLWYCAALKRAPRIEAGHPSVGLTRVLAAMFRALGDCEREPQTPLEGPFPAISTPLLHGSLGWADPLPVAGHAREHPSAPQRQFHVTRALLTRFLEAPADEDPPTWGRALRDLFDAQASYEPLHGDEGQAAFGSEFGDQFFTAVLSVLLSDLRRESFAPAIRAVFAARPEAHPGEASAPLVARLRVPCGWACIGCAALDDGAALRAALQELPQLIGDPGVNAAASLDDGSLLDADRAGIIAEAFLRRLYGRADQGLTAERRRALRRRFEAAPPPDLGFGPCEALALACQRAFELLLSGAGVESRG